MNHPSKEFDMTNLNKKLREALSQSIQLTRIGRADMPKPKNKVWFTAGGDMFQLDFTQAIAQIKQAFQDEGYIHVPQVEVVTRYEHGKKPEVYMVNGKEVMTGKEFYERFLKELGKPEIFRGYGYDSVGYDEDDVLEAARRAGGIDE